MNDYSKIFVSAWDAWTLDSESSDGFMAAIAAVVAAAKAEAMEEAATVAQVHGEAYRVTADRLFAEADWNDSSRYSNYASGLKMAAAEIRKATQ